jgi:hypothetical protein
MNLTSLSDDAMHHLLVPRCSGFRLVAADVMMTKIAAKDVYLYGKFIRTGSEVVFTDFRK